MVLGRDDERLHQSTLSVLSDGGVAILPCDTIYGFVGRVPDAESRIRAVKGRAETNPFLMLVGSLEQAAALAADPIDDRIAALWPGPLTLVVRGGQSTLAVRFPDDPFLTSIVRELGSPVYSTSVNRSGSAPLWKIRDIIAEFEQEVDLVVDAGDHPAGRPSTILDLTVRPHHIIRQGSFEVPAELLE